MEMIAGSRPSPRTSRRRRPSRARPRGHPLRTCLSATERFANGYLDALGERSAGAAPLPQIDWTFGPVGLRASAAEHWLRVDGDLWDAQIVPFVHAARWHGARVEALEVAYAHPPKMKAEEEGVPLWSEKRLPAQLPVRVGGALEEEAPAGA